MYRVCTLVNGGGLVEMQSGGDDIPSMMSERLNTLLQNAVNSGYAVNQVTVSWLTNEEWAQMASKLNIQ